MISDATIVNLIWPVLFLLFVVASALMLGLVVWMFHRWRSLSLSRFAIAVIAASCCGWLTVFIADRNGWLDTYGIGMDAIALVAVALFFAIIIDAVVLLVTALALSGTTRREPPISAKAATAAPPK